MFKRTHSAALEPPPPATHCEDCGYLWDYCKCGEPRCEGCNALADFQVCYEDDLYWFCSECEYEGERVQ